MNKPLQMFLVNPVYTVSLMVSCLKDICLWTSSFYLYDIFVPGALLHGGRGSWWKWLIEGIEMISFRCECGTWTWVSESKTVWLMLLCEVVSECLLLRCCLLWRYLGHSTFSSFQWQSQKARTHRPLCKSHLYKIGSYFFCLFPRR